MALRTIVTALVLLTLAPLATAHGSAPAQDEPVLDYSVDASGRVQLRVASTAERYYVLYARDDSGAEHPVSIALGGDGTTTLTEGLAAFPALQYRVVRHSITAPGDVDGDGRDDVTELGDIGRLGPFNPAEPINSVHGTTSIPDRVTFESLSYQGPEVRIDEHLRDLEFVKFYLLDMDTEVPRVYFMNTQTHRAHRDFARAIGLAVGERGGAAVRGQMRGEIVYHPHVMGPNGSLGVYRFEFEPNDSYPYAEVQRAYELIARNMPLLRNDWAYYPMPNSALPRYHQEKSLYDASRVAIILEGDIFADVRYVPLHQAEGFGRLTVMDLSERPNPRAIVLYETLPNELSRVGGIITTVPQTPLSHVNLRAIQDNVPNAYIADGLQNEVINRLIDKHVYYRVGVTEFELREATLAEVEAHYAALQPSQPQTPVRDLTANRIAPLDEIGFADWDSYGVKSANVAALRTFGLPAGTVPDGFGVPFYFYDEFMTYNRLYDEVRALLEDPQFLSDYDEQEARLAALRDAIKAADMPEWMLTELTAVQEGFGGVPIRCRSSTNNEDLPGFSGAGLYDSFTHHPDEGHLAKSIKQVYASLWTFRAFDERQFYRIDHMSTAMGVLLHENYESEMANGVGVTADPIYETEGTYYLNSQLGEDLVTNPNALSIPEEVLLGAPEGSGATLVRPSNQVGPGERVLSDRHLEEMRSFLGVIDSQFHRLYGIGRDDDFAMEIEYKITSADVLTIKQARPWLYSRDPAANVPTATAVSPTSTPVAPTATPSVPPSMNRPVLLPLVVR